MNKKFIPILIIISLAVGFGGGLWYSTTHGSSLAVVQKLTNQDVGKPQNVDFSLFWKVWADLQDKYVDKSKINVQKMLYGAISGMVSSVGDPYTVFFEPTTA